MYLKYLSERTNDFQLYNRLLLTYELVLLLGLYKNRAQFHKLSSIMAYYNTATYVAESY